jgi:hypothetical protein
MPATENITANITAANLAHFSGSLEYYATAFNNRIVMTEGVYFLAKNGAYWLVDAIVSHMVTNRKFRTDQELRFMSFWKLVVKDRKGKLTCVANSGRKPVVTQKIEVTDFPLDEIKIWAEVGSVDGREVMVLMLPGER